MAAPAYQAQGSIVKGGGALTVAWPTHQANDVALLLVETANQAATLTDAQGFVEVTGSPQGTGTGGTTGATRLTVFWKRASGSSEGSPIVADSGDHQIAVIVTFRGCITTGNPWDVTAGSVAAAATTAVSLPTVTTTVAEALIVLLLSNNFDSDTTEVTNVPTNSNLVGITKRLDTQPNLPNVGSTMLRVGPYAGMTGIVGIGPGGDTGAPYYRIAGINPHSESQAALVAEIALADDLDITIFATTPDSPAAFGANTATGFNQTAYNAKIDYLATIPEFVDAVQRGRIICLIADEPYHAKWDNSGGVNTFTPTVLRDCARYHKVKFGTQAITVARADMDKLHNGWDGNPVPASGWDALDYGVFQFEGPSAQAHVSFASAYATAKAHGDAVNIGTIPALNLLGGGNHVDVDGVNACWDYLNTGTSSGVIAGSVQGGSSPYSKGQQVECATWNATPTAGKRTLYSSPAWVRRVADVVAADANAPWLLFWIYATPTLGDYSYAGPLQVRSDFVAAYDYAVNTGLARASFNGFRATKVYP